MSVATGVIMAAHVDVGDCAPYSGCDALYIHSTAISPKFSLEVLNAKVTL